MASENASAPVDTTHDQSATVVQYILVRTDLEWGLGAMIAQACHASVASIATTLESSITKSYLGDLNNMHKVILKADKLEDLLKAERKLKEANIAHHMWIEQPENIATCLACSPQPKSLVQTIFRHFKLLRWYFFPQLKYDRKNTCDI